MRVRSVKELGNLLGDKRSYIFDFDGTVADTETLQWEAYRVYLNKYGIKLTEDDIKRYIGNTEYNIFKMVQRDFELEFDIQSAIKDRLGLYFRLVDDYNLQPFSYVKEIISKYSKEDFYILSSSKGYIIEMLLKKWGIYEEFKEIYSVADTGISKSEILRRLPEIVGHKHKDAVLFEDVDANLKLGKYNGLLSIGIEHNFNRGDLKNCDVIIEENPLKII